MKKTYSTSQIIRALGATLAILSMIFLLSAFTKTTWGIAFLFEYLFGLLGYWVLLPTFLLLGLTLLFKGEKTKKIVTGKFVIGFILAFVGASLIFGFSSACYYSDNSLKLFDMYGTEQSGLKGQFVNGEGIFSLINGGGIIFSSLASAINKVGKALTITISVMAILGGLFLIFFTYIMRFIHFVSSKAGAYKAKKESEENLRREEEAQKRALEEYVEQNKPIEVEDDENSPIASLPYDIKPETVEEPLSRTSLYHSKHISEMSPVPQETAPVEPAKANVFIQETYSNNGLKEAVFDPNEDLPNLENPSKPEVKNKPIVQEKPRQVEPVMAEVKPDFGEIVLPCHNEEPVSQKQEEEKVETPEEKAPAFIQDNKAPEEETFSNPTYVEPQEELTSFKEEGEEESKAEIEIPSAQEEKEPEISEDYGEISVEEEEESTPIVEPEPIVEEPKVEENKSESPLMQKKEVSEEEKLGIKPAKVRPPYDFPPLDLLKTYTIDPHVVEQNKLLCQQRTDIINQTFDSFNVGAQVVSYTIGPSVTRYDIQVERGVSVSSIGRYIKDVSARLGGVHTRYEEIIMGKTTSGLEIANDKSTTVSFREMLEALPDDPTKNMYVPFGVDISGNKICADLSEFPHMLIAGGTGSGKSVFAHGILASLIMRNRPEDVKLVLIDPKRVEMVKYQDIPHLLCPVIKDPNQAKVCLDKLIDEMEKRLILFEFAGVRNIRSYNEKYCPKAGVEPMPFIVVFIDEYADLSDTCKNIGESVVRIAQKARAAGIHLIVATQRPSVNVITGVIKANLGVRVALKVKSSQDSQTILGRGGAEELNGHGDMLVDCAQVSRGGGFVRCQGCFIQDEELEAVTEFIKSQQKVVYDPNFSDLSDHSNDAKIAEENEKIERAAQREKEKGDLYETIKADVMMQEYTSISKIQRTYSVGFPRAGKIFNRLKEEGIVGEPDSASSAKGARVLVHDPSMLSNGNERFAGDNDK